MINLIKTTDTKKENFVPGKPFNPNFDGNALAWYDGNVGLTVGGWLDQSGNGHNIVFANNPTIVANATPLRDAVRFDGINQTGNVATPVINQPFSIYIVINSIAWQANDVIYDDGVLSLQKHLFQRTGTPNLSFACGLNIDTNPDLAVPQWGLITSIGNGANSRLRTNRGAVITQNAGANNGNGIQLGALTGGAGNFWNGEIGYLIIRTGQDLTVTRNYIADALQSLCGLTF